MCVAWCAACGAWCVVCQMLYDVRRGVYACAWIWLCMAVFATCTTTSAAGLAFLKQYRGVCQLTNEALDISACEDIMNKFKRHVQTLLQKCVQSPYIRPSVVDIITDYTWNRSCNVAMHMFLDDILTLQKRPTQLSQQEFDYAFDLLQVCMGIS